MNTPPPLPASTGSTRWGEGGLWGPPPPYFEPSGGMRTWARQGIASLLWAHDCDSHCMEDMLGLASNTLAAWTARLQTCVANAEEARGIVLGGKGREVGCDGTEIGHKQKGTGGHKKVFKGDVWGVVERGGMLQSM